MRCKSMHAAIWILVGAASEIQGCHLGPLPSVPGVSRTYISHSASIQVDKNTVNEILKTFKQAEDAVQRRDLDTLMSLYADNYKHRGFTKDTLRAEWKQLFQDYRDFSTTHVLTRVAVELGKSLPLHRSPVQAACGRFPTRPTSESTSIVGLEKFTI